MNNVENKDLEQKIQLNDEQLKNVTGGAPSHPDNALAILCSMQKTEEDCRKINRRCQWDSLRSINGYCFAQ